MPKLTDYQPIWRPGYQPTQDLKYNLFVNRLKLILPTIDEDKNKKITMWWNLPPEELDEVIEANDGKLEPFTHVEEDETI